MTRYFLLLLLTLASGGFADERPVLLPAPIPDALRQQFRLAAFYQKHVMLGGLPIVSSAKCSDHALREAAWIVGKMLGNREDLLAAMAKNKVRLAVMAASEYTTDIPEHAVLEPKAYWDRRARGLGATRQAPAVSCAEENLLGFPDDPYADENILIHEFAHAIHETGLVSTDPTFDGRLKMAYESALARGAWKGTYAATDRQEYWAEGVQCWFDDNRQNDAQHNHVNTRVELREYDPTLAALCQEVLGDGDWRYVRPAKRAAIDRAHLADWDPAKQPKFEWRREPIPEKPQVSIMTELGEVIAELDYRAAPRTVENFLEYAHLGLYRDGRLSWVSATADGAKASVVQIEANPQDAARFLPPIALERTRETGLRHVEGSLSMVRIGPDTAQHALIICLADQPGRDFGGKDSADGQGFAAFGRVVKGLELLRKISDPAPVRIQRIIRLN